MGRDRVELTVYAYVSRHNSEQDKIDDAAWLEFIDRVKFIARDHRYESIDLDVM